jgi:hypothetical protein
MSKEMDEIMEMFEAFFDNLSTNVLNTSRSVAALVAALLTLTLYMKPKGKDK